jgi:2-phosphosulfolactate phosphatase
MMIDVVLGPWLLDRAKLEDAQVVVLDVLRATSTMVTALGNGAKEIRLFQEPEEVLAAKAGVTPPVVLGGERGCLKMPGFDVGNSPAEYVTHAIGGATILMSTTNGTRALLAAQGARRVLVGSLLNATATAEALLDGLDSGDTILVCAGTEGQVAAEDVIGAGAILWQVLQMTYRVNLPFTDTAWLAYHSFTAVRQRLGAALRLGKGGINLIEAGLEDDIDLCANIDARPLVVEFHSDPPRVIGRKQT